MRNDRSLISTINLKIQTAASFPVQSTEGIYNVIIAYIYYFCKLNIQINKIF